MGGFRNGELMDLGKLRGWGRARPGRTMSAMLQSARIPPLTLCFEFAMAVFGGGVCLGYHGGQSTVGLLSPPCSSWVLKLKSQWAPSPGGYLVSPMSSYFQHFLMSLVFENALHFSVQLFCLFVCFNFVQLFVMFIGSNNQHW